MLPAESVTGLFFTVAGVLAAFWGQVWLGVTAVLYGFVDCFTHECMHAAHAHACRAGILYDVGLLQFLDKYLQRLVALYSLTSFMFRDGLARALARALMTLTTFWLASSDTLSGTDADLISVGIYVGLWVASKALHQQPERRLRWVYASIVTSSFGFMTQHALEDLHMTARLTRAAVCASHVFFSLDIVFVALALRPHGRPKV
jgi:hypothetical protein